LIYEEVKIDVDLRYDLMVEEKVFKTYLRLTNITVGLVINFNVDYLKDGIKRMVNNFNEN
jgi:hypothetical protein